MNPALSKEDILNSRRESVANARIKKIYARLEKKNLDALLVSCAHNITYLTKFISRDSYFLVSPKGNIYFTDPRYTEEARIGLKGIAEIHKVNGSLFKIAADALRGLGLKRVGFEERRLTYSEHKKIKEALKRTISLIPTHSLIEEERQIKDAQELEKIKKAVR